METSIALRSVKDGEFFILDKVIYQMTSNPLNDAPVAQKSDGTYHIFDNIEMKYSVTIIPSNKVFAILKEAFLKS